MAAISPTLPGMTLTPSAEPSGGEARGFSDQLHSAQISAGQGIPDRPDPGGSPPVASTVGRASNPGPNAQSNQPDSLPTTSTKVTTTVKSVSFDAQSVAAALLAAGVAGFVPANLVSPIAPGTTSPATQSLATQTLPLGTQIPVTLFPATQTGVVAAQAAPVTIQAATITLTPQLLAAIQGAPAATQVAASPTPPTVVSPKSAPVTAATAQPITVGQATTPAVQPQTSANPTPIVAVTVQTAVANPTSAADVPVQTVTPRSAPLPQKSTAAPVTGKMVVSATAAAGEPIAATSSEGGSSSSTQKDSSQGSPDPNLAGQAAPTAIAAQGPVAPVSGPASLDSAQRIDVIKQVANHIETMAVTKPGQSVTIQLRPEGLGEVTVIVKSLASGIEATLSASNESVRSALSENRDALTQAATAKGLNIVSVHVAGQASFNANNAQSGARQHQNQASQTATNNAGANANTGSQRESRRSGPSGTAGHSISSTGSLTSEPMTFSAVSKDGLDYRT